MVFVELKPSPNRAKKYRVTFEDGSHVDFGGAGYSDYTIHKTPSRMRNYVRRHGGKIPMSTESLKTPKAIDQAMLRVGKSSSEDWSKSGIKTPGFWSRWLLWSVPNMAGAKKLLEQKFGIYVRTKKK